VKIGFAYIFCPKKPALGLRQGRRRPGHQKKNFEENKKPFVKRQVKSEPKRKPSVIGRRLTCHGSILFKIGTVLDNKQDRSTPALAPAPGLRRGRRGSLWRRRRHAVLQARDDMIKKNEPKGWSKRCQKHFSVIYFSVFLRTQSECFCSRNTDRKMEDRKMKFTPIFLLNSIKESRGKPI
jgi:hypothetical protein